MKILHLIQTTNRRAGGPIAGVMALSKVNINTGHSVTILTLDHDKKIEEKYENYPKILDFGKFKFLKKYYFLFWFYKNINNYDAVIINGLWSYFGFSTLIISYLKSNKVPYYIFPHGMLDPAFKKLYPIKHYKKYVYWLLIEMWVLRYAKYVFFTCSEEADLAKKTFKPYLVKSRVISYGIDTPLPINVEESKARFFKKYPELIDKDICLFLSRIHDKKGIDILITAMQSLKMISPKLRLIICGEGNASYVSKIKIMSKELGVSEMITWAGGIYGQDKADVFTCSDFFCLPTHQENFGIAIVEGLSYGLPILTTYKVNIWKEITEDGAAFIDYDTLSGTLNNINKYISLTKNDKKKMKEAAIRCYQNRFTVTQFSKELINIINI